MALAGCTYFADKNVLKSTLLDNTNWCKPTAFLGVPRVWEKVLLYLPFQSYHSPLLHFQIMEKMLEKAKDIKGLKKAISKQAKITGLKHHTEGDNDGLFKVFQKVYYTKVKALLGFVYCTHYFSGAAPIDKKV